MSSSKYRPVAPMRYPLGERTVSQAELYEELNSTSLERREFGATVEPVLLAIEEKTVAEREADLVSNV